MKTVVFDLDGTLADTSGDLIAAANACFEEAGLDVRLDPKRDAGTALRGGRAMLNLGFARAGQAENSPTIDGLYPRLIAHYGQNIDRFTTLYPGAMTAVRALKQRGYRVAICTNKPIALANQLLERLGILDEFHAVLGADSLPVRKPDPEHLFETVRQAGGSPKACLLVGDSDTDRNTSKAASVPSVLVTFGPSGDDMAALAPDVLLHDYNDLSDIVRNLLGEAA